MPYELPPKLDYLFMGNFSLREKSLYAGKRIKILIPQGFITDLATSPRIFWALIPPFGVYEAAAVLHDWLCTLLKKYHQAMERYKAAQEEFEGEPWKWPERPSLPQVNSVDTDGLFRRVMREHGVGFFIRWAMWAAVRWGALFSAHRRAGWWCWPEAPLVLLITAIELVLSVSIAVLIHLSVDRIWELISLRFLVLPLLIAIIGLVFLACLRYTSRRAVRRRDLSAARERAAAALQALDKVHREIELQTTAQRPDLAYLDELIRQEERKVHDITYRKELDPYAARTDR